MGYTGGTDWRERMDNKAKETKKQHDLDKERLFRGAARVALESATAASDEDVRRLSEHLNAIAGRFPLLPRPSQPPPQLGSSRKRSHPVQPLSNTLSLLQLGLKPRAAAGTYLTTLTASDTFIQQKPISL